jgi:predicted PurR-regulated permease PerM
MDHRIRRYGGFLPVFLAVAALYFARDIFVPLALAILLAFLLEPLARRLEQCHLGRVVSALAAVSLAVLIAGTMTVVMARQLGELGSQLPQYKANVHEKLRKLRDGDNNIAGRAIKSFDEFRNDLVPTNYLVATNSAVAVSSLPANPGTGPEPRPIPVEVRNDGASALQIVGKLISPSLKFLVKLFLVVIFCLFILIERDDLRTRLIRIVGSHNVTLTKQLLEEANHRLSRYLVMQLLVNIGYGTAIGLGLRLTGIPNPLLWGMMAGLLRYVPYAGPWIAASMPFAVGLAVGQGWGLPLMVFGVFAFVELFTANLAEPWLYGHSTGITSLAVLLAAAFWTWLWGPAGLLLSMPLTVCLVSIGRYFPQLELLDELFSEAQRPPKPRFKGGILERILGKSAWKTSFIARWKWH